MAVAAYAWCGFLALVLAREAGAATPRNVDEVLKTHGLPLFVAKTVQFDKPRWVFRANALPTIAGRLRLSGFQLVERKQQLGTLRNRVIIYCSEPGILRFWGELPLWVYWTRFRLARQSPWKTADGPAAALMQVGIDVPLHLRSPIRITLVFLDAQGRLERVERCAVIEFASLSE